MSESERDDQKWTTRAGTRLVAMLNRADELGGEVRDYVQDKMANDPRYVSARKTVARWLGRSEPSRPAAARPAPPPTPTASSQTVATSRVDAPVSRGFGDPGIKAQIFGKRSCPWSGRAISLLERHKVDFDFVDLEEPEHEAKLAPLSIETRQHTVPYVYLRGKFIGGFNALSEIERLGQLDTALMSAEQLAAAPAHIRVEIVPRPNTDEVAPAEVGPPPDGSG
jgi:glutaredoxin